MNPILKEDLERIIAEDIAWDQLKGKSVMVTGASGMLGTYFVRTVLALNEYKGFDANVICVVRNPKKIPADIAENKHVIIVQHDVSKPFDYDGDVDYIIHAASPASPLIMRNDPVGTIATNALGTFYTLQLAQEKKASGYMFISSREIYGQPDETQEFFTEDSYGLVDPLNARSCYPEGKKAAETMCVSFKEQYGLNTKIARLAHTYGPGMSIYDGRVQADFLNNVLHNENIVLKSDGSSVRTYTYIADAVAGMWRVLLSSDDVVYNVGDENGKVSIRELAELLVRINPEKNLKLVFDIPTDTNTGCAPFTMGILSSKRIRAIGWNPANTIEEGFTRTLRYLEYEKEAGNIE